MSRQLTKDMPTGTGGVGARGARRYRLSGPRGARRRAEEIVCVGKAPVLWGIMEEKNVLVWLLSDRERDEGGRSQ
uniref:Uncharacterized protein n=1 Tax=Knipowitschia caucasica TaxID=637954 RepID=A0AAV2JYS4_KNICA